jgi:hypothetical protein
LVPVVGELQLSDAAGVAPPVHEYPVDPFTQPVTVGSVAQLPVVPPSEQQNSVDPALPAVPPPQLSEGSACSGVSLPVHENP